MPLDVEFWKQWEGQYIDSAFPLERYAGGTVSGAVFESQREGAPTAIKIVTGTPEAGNDRIALWKKSAKLSHPALVKILATGQTKLAGHDAAYFVMERADDNLAAVLAERPLTPAETQEMLPPLLDVLEYLHANGYTHGALKPPNIMAFGDQLKVSSDNLVSGGDPAADCRAIGHLLNEVLGAKQNAALPEPFAGIAKNAHHWNLDQIKAHFRGDPAPATQSAAPSKSRGVWWAIAAGIVAALGLTLLLPPKDLGSTKATSDERTPVPRPQAKQPPAEPKSAARETPMGPLAGGSRPYPTTRQSTAEGVTQVLPDIPPAARNTITGRVRINIRVRVDNAGNVNQATPEPPLGSKYFTERVLAAARSWKFPAAGAPQTWILRFELTRGETLASSTKLSN